MQIKDKVAVITGAANGIGEALARRFHKEGARAIVVCDIDGAGAERVAKEIGGFGLRVDVGKESEIQNLVHEAESRYGAIDLFCSNAGIFIPGGIEAPNEDWARMRDIHVMAHIYAARAVLPKMLERGQGYLLQTVSAAGLLTSMESAIYAVTKHASLALAEWISMTYGDRGIRVSAICPQGVRTNMLMQDPNNFLMEGSVSGRSSGRRCNRRSRGRAIPDPSPPRRRRIFRWKSSDYDRWLRGMRRLRTDIAAKKAQA